MSSRKSSVTCEPWEVGILFSRTGYMAVIEETQLCGTLLAIEEINEKGGINGRELVPVMYDPASSNSLYKKYAHKLLVEHGITTIFGCYTSSSRKAVLPIIEVRELAKQHTADAIERLVAWMRSDNPKASVAAANVLLD